jgi:exodeoxyribonuclease-3
MQRNDATAAISLFCWNIGNPSIERAKKQVEWLKNRGENFLILTEAKGSKGCRYMNDYFKNIGYNTIFPDMDPKEYGTIIVSKYALEKSEFTNNIDFLSARVVAVNVVLPLGKTEIIGLFAEILIFLNQIIIRIIHFLRIGSMVFMTVY